MSYIKEAADDSIVASMQRIKLLVDYATAQERLELKEKAEDNLIGLKAEEEKEELYCYKEL